MLEFESAYNLNCMVRLKCNRAVKLESLDQELTYAGLLEGTPDAKSNDGNIEAALDAARRRCAPGAEPFLIAPCRRDYLREIGDMTDAARLSPNRRPEWLPMVRCIASFTHIKPVRDPARDFSALVVLWYQEEFAMPILPPALDALFNLDWDTLATDVDV
ncbi:MAG: hypothetical protein ACTHK7_17330 [Aureliella sp.]